MGACICDDKEYTKQNFIGICIRIYLCLSVSLLYSLKLGISHSMPFSLHLRSHFVLQSKTLSFRIVVQMIFNFNFSFCLCRSIASLSIFIIIFAVKGNCDDSQNTNFLSIYTSHILYYNLIYVCLSVCRCVR